MDGRTELGSELGMNMLSRSIFECPLMKFIGEDVIR
jgi:hypothetical protein